MNVDHIANDIVVSIDEYHVMPEELVLIAARSRWQLAQERPRHSVHLLLKRQVQGLAGLKTAFLFRRQLIL